jgi:hypothetical protein
MKHLSLVMPSLQLYTGVSLLPALKTGQSWIQDFSFGLPLIFRLMMKNFRKLSYGTHFKKFSQA